MLLWEQGGADGQKADRRVMRKHCSSFLCLLLHTGLAKADLVVFAVLGTRRNDVLLHACLLCAFLLHDLMYESKLAYRW